MSSNHSAIAFNSGLDARGRTGARHFVLQFEVGGSGSGSVVVVQ